MAHRRTLSTIYSPLNNAAVKEDGKVRSDLNVNASGVGLGISAILSSVLAPALPLAAMRPSITSTVHRADTSPSTSSSPSTSFSDDDYMSMSSLDLQTPPTPLTPGTPSKISPHPPLPHSPPPRFPAYASSESSSRNSIARTQYSARRFVSRLLATLSPRAPGLPLKSPHLSPSSSYSYLASLPTRTHAPIRRRATFLALLALIALCIWTLFTSSLGDTQSRTRPYSDGVMRSWKDWRNRVQNSEGDERARLLNSASFRGASSLSHTISPETNFGGQIVPLLELTPSEELAALTAFIAALPWNALPSHVDPTRPLDPTIILDFDPSHPRARDELAALRRETWQLNPVVLFGKSRHAPSRELRNTLEALSVDMKKGVMDVDMAERVDGEIVLGVLGRLVDSLESGSSSSARDVKPVELPLLLVGGKPIRGSEVPDLVRSGDMPRLLREAGVRMAVPGKKKKGH